MHPVRRLSITYYTARQVVSVATCCYSSSRIEPVFDCFFQRGGSERVTSSRRPHETPYSDNLRSGHNRGVAASISIPKMGMWLEVCKAEVDAAGSDAAAGEGIGQRCPIRTI